jgi:hypothetical protein
MRRGHRSVTPTHIATAPGDSAIGRASRAVLGRHATDTSFA